MSHLISIHPSLTSISLCIVDYALKEFDELLDDKELLVCIFTAPWCSPCTTIAPLLEEAASEFTGATFAHVDVDEEPVFIFALPLHILTVMCLYSIFLYLISETWQEPQSNSSANGALIQKRN